MKLTVEIPRPLRGLGMTNGGGIRGFKAIKGVKGFNVAAILIFSHIEKHERLETNRPKFFQKLFEHELHLSNELKSVNYS